ncbi:hypothetical protein GLP43_09105 [Sulfitobacter sp. M39]|uniref:hypothetical protein n=1 Tax=Sulfitobacter sp. M39 TaxID=2675334 RepID=UPI001F3EA678|nr:hypothetical protein [Sulfitobacter sp. M39]MCF7747722.1 hypothetical protein [Sulfitobacter sp. M39]
MAETIKQVEAIPASYPDIGQSELGFAPTDDSWQRIESYIAHRFTPREVIWTVEGEGDWTPPLKPVTAISAEKWENGWVEVTLPEGPYGYCLPGDGPYRITATVGPEGVEVDGVTTYAVPTVVAKAAHRLTQYCLIQVDKDDYGRFTRLPEFAATSARYSGEGENAAETELERPSTWIAKAMQNSGAADLLRPYRRA